MNQHLKKVSHVITPKKLLFLYCIYFSFSASANQNLPFCYDFTFIGEYIAECYCSLSATANIYCTSCFLCCRCTVYMPKTKLHNCSSKSTYASSVAKRISAFSIEYHPIDRCQKRVSVVLLHNESSRLDGRISAGMMRRKY
jgi:hypothetical protein